MKKPIVWFAISFMIVLFVVIRYDATIFLREYGFQIGCALVFIVCSCIVLHRVHGVSILFAGALCGLLLTTAYHTYFVQPIQLLDDTKATFTATIKQYPVQYEAEQRVEVSVKPQLLGLSSARPDVSILLYLPMTTQELTPGDQIEIAAEFYLPRTSDGFARQSYYASNGIFLLGKYQSDTQTEEVIYFKPIYSQKIPVWYIPLHIANMLKDGIYSAINEREAGFLAAVLLGDKSGMPPDDAQALKKSGLSHIAAVSGMHIGFLVGFFYMIFGRRAGSILSIVAILLFIPMAGASPSVIRAGLMYILASVSFCIGRETNGLSSLSYALVLILITNPYALFSISLQLSFASTLGLILCGSRWQKSMMQPFLELPKPLRKVARVIISSAACSFASLLFTIPITVFVFGYVSALSPIANLLAVSMVGFIFILGFLTAIFSCIFPPIGTFFGVLVTPCIDYILWVTHKISAFPYGLVYADNSYSIFGIIAVYIFFASILLPRPVKFRYTVPLLCGILIVTIYLGAADDRDLLSIRVLPSGSGQTIAVSEPNNVLTLIDCSASGYRNAADNVSDMMSWYGYDEIETIVLTAVDLTHARSVPDVLRSTRVGRIIIPTNVRESDIYTQIKQTAAQYHVPILVWDRVAEQPLSSSISLIGGMKQKLVARVHGKNQDILILHSLTQKILSALLSQHALTAKTIVLSERNIEDPVLMHDALMRLQPDSIILQSGYTTQTRMLQYNVQNTYIIGELIIKTHMNE